MNKTLEGIANAGIGVAAGIFLNICPYAMPTAMCVATNISNEREKRTPLESIGFGISLATGVAGLSAQGGMYHENPEYLLIPLVTNMISGAVELGTRMRTKSS